MIGELKPCPFCGGHAKLNSPKKLKERGYQLASHVYCETCFAQSPPKGCVTVVMGQPLIKARSRQDEEAIDAWNTRVEGKPLA